MVAAIFPTPLDRRLCKSPAARIRTGFLVSSCVTNHQDPLEKPAIFRVICAIPGTVLREVQCKFGALPAASSMSGVDDLRQPMGCAERIRSQRRLERYALHALEVDGMGEGETRRPCEAVGTDAGCGVPRAMRWR
jgi:hypothetical protein